MNDNKILKIISAILFVAFAGVSCWATVESIYLSLPDFPKIIFWVAVVGIFLLTSYLTTIVVNAFNPNIFMDKRGLKLIGGLLGVLLLWLCFSMPTNTHTFFYKKMAKEVALKELNFLDVELSKLTDTNLYFESYNKQWNEYVNKVKSQQKAFESEIDNFQQLGQGDRAEERLQKVEQTMGLKIGTLQRLKKVGNGSQKERNQIKKHYDNQINDQLEIQRQEQIITLRSQLNGFKKEAKRINGIKSKVSQTLKELNNPRFKESDVLDRAKIVAEEAHNTLDAKYGYLKPDDSYKSQKVYTLNRLRSITDVWKDYLKGEFKGKNYGLTYWILLSVIVDLAAFLFFNLAFKK